MKGVGSVGWGWCPIQSACRLHPECAIATRQRRGAAPAQSVILAHLPSYAKNYRARSKYLEL